MACVRVIEPPPKNASQVARDRICIFKISLSNAREVSFKVWLKGADSAIHGQSSWPRAQAALAVCKEAVFCSKTAKELNISVTRNAVRLVAPQLTKH